MDDLMNNGTIPVALITAIIIVVIVQIGASWRARLAVARESEYREVAERALKAQEALQHELAAFGTQQAGVARRLDAIESVLKTVE